ncbi:hypothetical protein [Pantoea allii]|uniref:hypothetical protein n=1 Tax=Pantoea allii TaxID=574096 RepID=UPI000A21C33C|nr:hypothetical protein [Pantoea allii]MBW1251939.1 hypothetical protein [Pantoea allii]MBW1260536.1 hypothetical protein [Pantoea allii]MBW1283133.1 hypothetical protein [Pantoea allii]ORM84798.1 hypothetical protein HA38_14080 [Pantoea allii]PBJ98738.1 hypothetical protein CMR03_18740 [Pantoea allii]
MDSLTFLSSIIKSLAWPSVVIFILYFGRNDILKLVRDLKSLKYDKFELLFEQRVEEAASQADVIAEENPEIPNEDYQEFSFLSPFEAVMKSYNKLFEASYLAFDRLSDSGRIPNNISTSLRRRPAYLSRIAKTFRDSDLIGEDEFILFHELQSVRNMAAHRTDLKITHESAKSYVKSVFTLINKIKNFS